MKEKTCKDCGETKAIDLFPIDSRGRIRCHCAPCYASQQKIRYQKWLERGRAGTRRSEKPQEQTIACMSIELLQKSIYRRTA